MPAPDIGRRYARRVYHPYVGRIDPKRRRRLLAIADELPRSPGIYRFYGYKDRLLYIGKAVCLRDRVRSYFAETTLRRSYKLRRLLVEVNRLEFQPCGSELEAMLLERRTIAALRPLLNREHKRFDIYPYLLLTDEEYPRLALTRTEPIPETPVADADSALPLETPPYPGELPGLYIGPFTTPRLARETYDIVRDLFPLRTCEGKLKPDPAGRDCYYHELGRCLAPCVAAVDHPTYRRLCDELIALLRTGDSPQLGQLRARMEEFAAAWQFEEAAALREQLRALAAATARLRRIEGMRERNNVVILQPSHEGPPRFNAFLIRHGVTRRHLHVDDWDALARAVGEVYTACEPAAAFTGKAELDEMMLLDRWLRAHGTEACCAWIGASAPKTLQAAVRQLRKWAKEK